MPTSKESTTTDDVVQEVRKIKELLAQAFDFDIDRILADAREKQRNSGRQILSPPVVSEKGSEKEDAARF